MIINVTVITNQTIFTVIENVSHRIYHEKRDIFVWNL